MKSIHPTEAQIIKKLSKADEQALKWVFDKYHRRIYQFALQFLKDDSLSEEVVQDTFLRLWLNREKIDSSKPLAPYLFTIARRKVIDVYRQKVVSDKAREQAQLMTELSRNYTEDEVLQRDVEKLVMEVMQQLTNQQQAVFRLSRVNGLSYEEIAEELSISKSTVKQHLVGALKTMRTYFNKHDLLYLFVLYFMLNAK